MKIDSIHEIWDKDCQIDRTELGEESLKIAQLHSKYFKLFADERLVLKRLEQDYKLLYKNKYEYYNGTMTYEDLQKHSWEPFRLKILKSDLPLYIEADNDIHNLQNKIELQKEKVSLLENIIKSLNSRGYQIKSAIDWIKFQTGI